MAKYDITIGGETFEVESAQPLTDTQAYNAALPEYTKLRAKQSGEEEAGRAAGGQYKIGAAGFQDAARAVTHGDARVTERDWLHHPLESAANMIPSDSFAGRFLQGAGETADRYAYGLKGLFTDLSPEEKLRLAQNKILADQGGGAATLGQIGGDLAITGPVMAAGGALAGPVMAAGEAVAQAGRALPMALRAMRSLPGRLAQVAAPTAALGALSSPEDRTEGVLYGAAGGLAGAGVTRAVGGALKPFISREGQELIEQGIQPTPGQAVGGRVGQWEEKLGSVPLIGDIIGRSRNRALREYNEALAGRVSQAVTGDTGAPRAAGRALGEVGDEALLALRKQIGQVYEDALGQAPLLRIERAPIEKAVADIASDPGLALSDESAKRLFGYVERNLFARGEDISGQTAKRIESDMGKAVARFKSGNATSEERAYGEALERVHATWRNSVMGSLPEEAQRTLQNANAAWRGFLPLDQAAATATSQLRESKGVFTPRVLRQALAKADKSQADNMLRGLQRQPVAAAANPHEYVATMSRAGQSLGDVVPDSGTAGRMGLGGLAVGAIPTAFAHPMAALGGAAGVAATAGAYSRAGAQLLTQGAFPATREAVASWLAKQGIPREALPTLVEQTLALYGRVGEPTGANEYLRRALISASQ